MRKKIRENVYFLNAVDWNRRLFDSLIPLPEGTSYNAYLIQGSDKTVLIDTVDPSTVSYTHLSIIIFNYDLKPGYSGVDNPIYKRKNGVWVFQGDASETLPEFLNKL